MLKDSELEHIPDEQDLEHNTSDFIDKFVLYWDNNLDVTFTKKGDRLLAAAVIELFRKRERIELFNKKALYIYIREMSNASTQQITKMVKTMKDKYTSMYMDYLHHGYILKNKKY